LIRALASPLQTETRVILGEVEESAVVSLVIANSASGYYSES
jgi:hypothetical protein